MLWFRLWLLCVIVGGGWALACFFLTRNAMYLRYLKRIVLGSFGLIVLQAGIDVGLHFLYPPEHP